MFQLVTFSVVLHLLCMMLVLFTLQDFVLFSVDIQS
jgi:hypothetical protein